MKNWNGNDGTTESGSLGLEELKGGLGNTSFDGQAGRKAPWLCLVRIYGGQYRALGFQTVVTLASGFPGVLYARHQCMIG
jgi:hypothetical protein